MNAVYPSTHPTALRTNSPWEPWRYDVRLICLCWYRPHRAHWAPNTTLHKEDLHLVVNVNSPCALMISPMDTSGPLLHLDHITNRMSPKQDRGCAQVGVCLRQTPYLLRASETVKQRRREARGLWEISFLSWLQVNKAGPCSCLLVQTCWSTCAYIVHPWKVSRDLI